MPTSRKLRRGVSLLELLVVVVLMGIVTSVAAMRFGRSLFSEFGAEATVRELSLALLACQRAAIRSGDDHYVEFTLNGTSATEYRIMRDDGAAGQLVDGPKPISSDVTVNVSNTTMRYDFDGAAGGAYHIDVTGINRAWQLDVVPITGTVQVGEVP